MRYDRVTGTTVNFYMARLLVQGDQYFIWELPISKLYGKYLFIGRRICWWIGHNRLDFFPRPRVRFCFWKTNPFYVFFLCTKVTHRIFDSKQTGFVDISYRCASSVSCPSYKLDWLSLLRPRNSINWFAVASAANIMSKSFSNVSSPWDKSFLWVYSSRIPHTVALFSGCYQNCSFSQSCVVLLNMSKHPCTISYGFGLKCSVNRSTILVYVVPERQGSCNFKCSVPEDAKKPRSSLVICGNVVCFQEELQPL